MADKVLNKYESRYRKPTKDPVQQLARQNAE